MPNYTIDHKYFNKLSFDTPYSRWKYILKHIDQIVDLKLITILTDLNEYGWMTEHSCQGRISLASINSTITTHHLVGYVTFMENYQVISTFNNDKYQLFHYGKSKTIFAADLNTNHFENNDTIVKLVIANNEFPNRLRKLLIGNFED